MREPPLGERGAAASRRGVRVLPGAAQKAQSWGRKGGHLLSFTGGGTGSHEQGPQAPLLGQPCGSGWARVGGKPAGPMLTPALPPGRSQQCRRLQVPSPHPGLPGQQMAGQPQGQAQSSVLKAGECALGCSDCPANSLRVQLPQPLSVLAARGQDRPALLQSRGPGGKSSWGADAGAGITPSVVGDSGRPLSAPHGPGAWPGHSHGLPSAGQWGSFRGPQDKSKSWQEGGPCDRPGGPAVTLLTPHLTHEPQVGVRDPAPQEAVPQICGHGSPRIRRVGVTV